MEPKSDSKLFPDLFSNDHETKKMPMTLTQSDNMYGDMNTKDSDMHVHVRPRSDDCMKRDVLVHATKQGPQESRQHEQYLSDENMSANNEQEATVITNDLGDSHSGEVKMKSSEQYDNDAGYLPPATVLLGEPTVPMTSGETTTSK